MLGTGRACDGGHDARHRCGADAAAILAAAREHGRGPELALSGYAIDDLLFCRTRSPMPRGATDNSEASRDILPRNWELGAGVMIRSNQAEVVAGWNSPSHAGSKCRPTITHLLARETIIGMVRWDCAVSQTASAAVVMPGVLATASKLGAAAVEDWDSPGRAAWQAAQMSSASFRPR